MKCSGFDYATRAWTEVSGGAVIQSVEQPLPAPASGPLLAPGFIDIQVNGFAGVDYCGAGASVEDIGRSLEAQFACGVTRLLPTVITGGYEEMQAAIRGLAQARGRLPYGRAMEGFHIEGPHISPEDGPRGAHPRRHVRPPDFDEFLRWQEAAGGLVKLVTLSPEWPGSIRYIERVAATGVTAAIGHMQATAEQIDDAVRAGAVLSTHLGNGSHASLPRHPNYLWQQLADDRLTASFIADGIHLDRSFLTVALRAKGVLQSILVTDAVAPAGSAPGHYTLGAIEVTLHPEQRVTLRDSGRLAGSALHMHHGVGNLMRLAGLTLTEAVTTATRNPARVTRIAGRQRGLVPGDRFDAVRFEFDSETQALRILETILDGETVYRA
jgi:N-acetylglucosamine-6-phosphate deacetylase